MTVPDPETFHQPIRLAPPPSAPADETPQRERGAAAPLRARSKFSLTAFLLTVVLSGTWMGAVGAYVLGYFHSRGGNGFDVQEIAIFVVATFVPPLLFLAICWVLIRGQKMGEAAEIFAEATEQLFSADETATRTAIRIGRSVRHELDALNAGLDTAFGRMRALEGLLKTQIEEMDAVGGRMDQRGVTLAGRLDENRKQIETAAAAIEASASQAGEGLAGRASLLKSTLEAAENALKAAGERMDGQTAHFRQAAAEAAQAPHAAAVELDKQVKRIEQVSEAAMSRAEFVLGRQERHRVAMSEMLESLKERGLAFETALSAEREAMERMLAGLDSETKKFDQVTADTQRRLDAMMATAATRTAQMTGTFAREAQHVKEAGDAAARTLAGLAQELQKAGAESQAAIGQTTAKARAEAASMVGSAMGEVAKLLSAADQMSDEATRLRALLAEAFGEIQRQMEALPAAAQTEAAKVRQAVRTETEEMLTLSAQTLATLHAKAAPKPVLTLDRIEPREDETAGMNFFKRHLTTPKRKPDAQKGWQMSALLAAAEGTQSPPRTPNLREQMQTPPTHLQTPPTHRSTPRPAPTTPPSRTSGKPSAAAALGLLQETLADMAVDLDVLTGGEGPTTAEWRRYLEGDRGVFARKLANAIDGETVHRIAMLYRESTPFRAAADAYMEEFEGLLDEARLSGGGLLATSLLSADTGKIYLAISYALGRM